MSDIANLFISEIDNITDIQNDSNGNSVTAIFNPEELNEVYVKSLEDLNSITNSIKTIEKTKELLIGDKLTIESAVAIVLSLNNFEDYEGLTIEGANDDKQGIIAKFMLLIKKLWESFKSVVLALYRKGMEIIRKVLAIFKKKKLDINNITVVKPESTIALIGIINNMNASQEKDFKKAYDNFLNFLEIPYYLFENITTWGETTYDFNLYQDKFYLSGFYRRFFVGKSIFPNVPYITAINKSPNDRVLYFDTKGTCYTVHKSADTYSKQIITNNVLTHFRDPKVTVDMLKEVYNRVVAITEMDMDTILKSTVENIKYKLKEVDRSSTTKDNVNDFISASTIISNDLNALLLLNIKDMNGLCGEFINMLWKYYAKELEDVSGVILPKIDGVFGYVDSYKKKGNPPEMFGNGMAFNTYHGVDKFIDIVDKLAKACKDMPRPTFFRSNSRFVYVGTHSIESTHGDILDFVITWEVGDSREKILETAKVMFLKDKFNYDELMK